MNRDEAKLILHAYRPGGRDANDPYFAEALGLIKRDAELAAWFAKQQGFDARISGSLQGVRVPSRLKAEILARNRPKQSPTLSWWHQLFARQSPSSWAMAVLILMIFGLTLLWNHFEVKTAFAEYSAQMVIAAMQDQYHVDREVSNLKTALASMPTDLAENNLALPLRLDKGNGLMGCRALVWHGQNVAMLCFMPPGGEHVDLFVAAANLFSDAPPVDQPRFARSNGTPTASWTHKGEAYLVVGHGDAAFLKNLWSPARISRSQLKLLAQIRGTGL